MCPVEYSSGVINRGAFEPQWKERVKKESIDAISFIITSPCGKPVSYTGGNIYFSIGIRPRKSFIDSTKVDTANWAVGTKKVPSNRFTFQVSTDDYIEASNNPADFSVNISDIAGLRDHQTGGALELGNHSRWEVALTDFSMPNNIDTFMDGKTNKAFIYICVKHILSTVHTGHRLSTSWELWKYY